MSKDNAIVDGHLPSAPADPVKTIMKIVPPEKREEVKEAIMVIQQESFSGPIPSPKAIADYEKILPGSADRILTMAEQQQKHRFDLEKDVIIRQSKDNSRGQIFAFIIFFVCVAVAACFAFLLEMKTFASWFLSGTMVVLIALFVRGKVEIKRNLSSKNSDKQA